MAIRYGFLSSHPPTQCGLAAFNLALASAAPAPTRRSPTAVGAATGCGTTPHAQGLRETPAGVKGLTSFGTYGTGRRRSWLPNVQSGEAFDGPRP